MECKWNPKVLDSPLREWSSSCLSPSSDSLGASKGTGLGKAATAKLCLNLMEPYLEGAMRLAKLAIKVGGG